MLFFSLFMACRGELAEEPIAKNISEPESHTVVTAPTEQPEKNIVPDTKEPKRVDTPSVQVQPSVSAENKSSAKPVQIVETTEKIKKESSVAVSEPIPPSVEEKPAELQKEQSNITKNIKKPTITKRPKYTKPGPSCVRSIKRVLRKKQGEVRFCYDQQKVKEPSLEGKITVQINVHKSRNSMWVKNDTLKSRGLRSCLKKKIKSWEFGTDCVGTSFKKSYSLVPG